MWQFNIKKLLRPNGIFMQHRVLIRAFTLRRDVGWAILVKKILEAKGASVCIASSRNFSLIMRLWKPHIVVVNTVGQLENSLHEAPNSRLIFWPGEGGESWEVSDAKMMVSRSGVFEKLAAIFAWGDVAMEQYRRAFSDIPLDKVIQCGNPRLDLVKFFPKRLLETSSIGFATRFNSLNHADGRPTLYTLTNPGNLDSVVAQSKGFLGFLDAVKTILDNTDYLISIRPHPLEAPEFYRRYVQSLNPARISIDVGFDFLIWQKRQRVVITPTSSIGIELYILKTPLVSIDALSETEGGSSPVTAHTEFLGARYAFMPKNREELLELVEAGVASKIKISEDSETDRFLKRVHDWPRDHSSILKGCESILSIASENHEVPRGWLPKTILRTLDVIDIGMGKIHLLHRDDNNFRDGFHHIDKIYDEIVAEIMMSGNV